MIIKARHNWIIYTFFKIYTIYKIHRNFHKVFISGEFIDRNLPVLLISNHISWWDGFWAMYVNLKKFKRKFYFMMLENQLNKYWFFKKSGGFSVKKKSKSIIESIQYSAKILSDPDNILLLFPQGQINSLYKSFLEFEKGTELILKDKAGKVQIIFMANLINYFSHSSPSLFIYLAEYKDTNMKINKIQEAYNIFYAECISVINSKTESE